MGKVQNEGNPLNYAQLFVVFLLGQEKQSIPPANLLCRVRTLILLSVLQRSCSHS